VIYYSKCEREMIAQYLVMGDVKAYTVGVVEERERGELPLDNTIF
jgi:hypothetical protein